MEDHNLYVLLVYLLFIYKNSCFFHKKV